MSDKSTNATSNKGENSKTQSKISIGQKVAVVPLNENIAHVHEKIFGWMGDANNAHLCMCGFPCGHGGDCYKIMKGTSVEQQWSERD